MNGSLRFPCFHVQLYAVESRSLGDDPELLGIFTSLKEAVRVYDMFNTKRSIPFIEGDLLSLYEVKNNSILWEGLERNILWRNQWGTFYIDGKYREKIEAIQLKLIRRGQRLISL